MRKQRPEHTNTPNVRLWNLQKEQEDLRESERRAGNFTHHEMDELVALRKFALDMFGDANTQYAWPGGEQPYRYGGLLEGGPEEVGILYCGFYIDPPAVPLNQRRRHLIFRGCKVREFEEQARCIGMMV